MNISENTINGKQNLMKTHVESKRRGSSAISSLKNSSNFAAGPDIADYPLNTINHIP